MATKALEECLEKTLEQITDSSMLAHIQKWLEETKSYNKLDHELRETIEYLAHADGKDVYDSNMYPDIVNELAPGSTVIYFRSAGKIRVYEGDEFTELFQNRLRTNYKNQDEIYEVVDDNKPQKIVIIVDSRDKQELNKLKKYIIEFTRQSKHKIEMDDLHVFDDQTSETFDIVIDNIQVSNSQAKKLFTEGLLQYVEKQEKNTKLSNKLTRPLPDISGANIVKIPELKKYLTSVPNADEICAYVTRFGGNPTVILNVTNYINSGPGIQVNQISGSNTANIENVTDGISDEDFIAHLENGNFEWFESGNEVILNQLYDEYCKFNQISPQKFANKFRDKLYEKVKRIKNAKRKSVWLVKLL